jgi:ABC-type Fe3+/spermidine/putrescine transport system ATPase subunit
MLSIANVSYHYESTPVLNDFNLEVKNGEILCLLGPSGCGKTTLLRVVAGLERPTSGNLFFNGESILDTPVNERDFGLMFQEYALFPHMTVADNITFGLKMRGLPANLRAQRLQEILDLVGMAGLESRNVGELSGGERQRVALGRSLAPSPRLLMLDEPLASIDAALREQLVIELREIVKQIGIMAIYVTHDQAEAFAIADRVAVMRTGAIEQVDTPEQIYQHPQTEYTARFLGLTNILPATGSVDGRITTACGEFDAPPETSGLLLHPAGISLTPTSDSLSLAGSIERAVFKGSHYQIDVQVDNNPALRLGFRLPVGQNDPPAPGEAITLYIEKRMIVPLR